MIKLTEVGKTCPECGTFFLGNKCPKCGWEVLHLLPKQVKKTKPEKRKINGVYG